MVSLTVLMVFKTVYISCRKMVAIMCYTRNTEITYVHIELILSLYTFQETYSHEQRSGHTDRHKYCQVPS